MRKPEEIKPLKIALIAYDYVQADMAIKDIILNNFEHIKDYHKHDGLIIFNDGTIIKTVNSIWSISGSDYDQIIICDDYRWGVLLAKGEIIDYLCTDIRYRSCIPEDFQVIRYEF